MRYVAAPPTYRMQSIYDRIKDVTPNVYPDYPAENTSLPYVVYRVTSTEPTLSLSGPTALSKFTVQIDTHAETFAGVAQLQADINTQLQGYRGGSVQGCFLSTQSAEETDDESFQGVQVFSVWSTES